MKKIFIITSLIVLIGNVSAQDYDKKVKDLQADLASEGRPQEQVISLTRKNLALEIENRKLHERIDELNRMVIEAAKEKKDLEVELKEAEKELVKLEKNNDVLEQKNQALGALLEKVRTLVIPSPKS